MTILSIETSCDETAIAIIEAEGDEKNARFKIRGNALISQIDIHKEYGGVFPALAKREHAKNLVPLLQAALAEAEMLREETQEWNTDMRGTIATFLSREPGLAEAFFAFVGECEPPNIDAIAITTGPGLEPALWVGISFAKALALVWNTPIVAVNHMEGHILAALAQESSTPTNLEIANVELPLLALLISGGHTELVVMKKWLDYELVGQTRDDAVGEAFDKVARLMDLPYPGGPEISKLAEKERVPCVKDVGTAPSETPSLPRPMIHEPHCDFSFSGLKTAVLYLLKKRPNLSEKEKRYLACEFEDAVTEVLWEKTARALEDSCARTLVIGGGVSANTHIRRTFAEEVARDHPQVDLRIPPAPLSTDNALMIALAGYYRALLHEFTSIDSISASGTKSLA